MPWFDSDDYAMSGSLLYREKQDSRLETSFPSHSLAEFVLGLWVFDRPRQGLSLATFSESLINRSFGGNCLMV